MGRAQTDYRGFYGDAKDLFLPVSSETGTLLYMLARAAKARSIVEYGTSFGLSTLHLAAALRDNGGGRLIGSEFEPSKVARAREHLAEAGLADLVEIREGDALETLARDLPEADRSRPPRRRQGALPADPRAPRAAPRRGRADRRGQRRRQPRATWLRLRDPANGYLSVPFGSDVELSIRLAGRPVNHVRAR